MFSLVLLIPLLASAETVTNIVVMIGDGMGLAQVRATRSYKGAPLAFESWTQCATVDTRSVSWPLPTDSAAAGTAIATGNKVSNGVVSVRIPGNRESIPTLLEYFKKAGKRTGLVTTSFMTDATPAAFGAHAANRSLTGEIARCYFTQSQPDVLYGGGGNCITASNAAAAGYTVVTDRRSMLSLDNASVSHVSGQFGKGPMRYEYDGVRGMPHLSEMTASALSILEHNRSGFFLMIEGGNIDHACHINNPIRMVKEMLDFEKSIQLVEKWAANRNDTLIIVTADHETGGLSVMKEKRHGWLPKVSWKTRGHTGTNVGLWARGPGSSRFSGQISNTNIIGAVISASATGDNP